MAIQIISINGEVIPTSLINSLTEIAMSLLRSRWADRRMIPKQICFTGYWNTFILPTGPLLSGQEQGGHILRDPLNLYLISRLKFKGNLYLFQKENERRSWGAASKLKINSYENNEEKLNFEIELQKRRLLAYKYFKYIQMSRKTLLSGHHLEWLYPGVTSNCDILGLL